MGAVRVGEARVSLPCHSKREGLIQGGRPPVQGSHTPVGPPVFCPTGIWGVSVAGTGNQVL